MDPKYLDFDVEIGIGQGREYPVSARSQAGEARETMKFPFDQIALKDHLRDLHLALLRSGGPTRRTPSVEERSVLEFGQALFDALITGEVRSCFDKSLEHARTQHKGLRLRLRFSAPELASLPWEYLYDRRNDHFLSLYKNTPLVRYLELSQHIQPLTVKPPIRILGLIASPKDMPRLDAANEKRRIEEALGELRAAGRVSLDWLPGQTWRDLHLYMMEGPWHILHFVGHGRYNESLGEGVVFLSNDEGYAQELPARKFAQMLANHVSLRLVLMNSCESALGGTKDVFSSTASIMVRQGIPAVIAMQHEISDQAAIELSRAFYLALARGFPVDAALTEARLAVNICVTNTVEWGTPVLHMRSPDGHIFDLETLVGSTISHKKAPPQTSPKLQRQPPPHLKPELGQLGPLPEPVPPPDLEKCYTDALDHYYAERWPAAIALFEKVVAQQPNYLRAADRLEDAQRQQTLVVHYVEAEKAHASAQWAAAIEHLEAVVALEPNYKSAPIRLVEARKQRVLAELYDEAQRLFSAQKWPGVVQVFARIDMQDPDYPDPTKLRATAKEELAKRERERNLATLYDQALRALDAGRLDEARGGFEKLAQLSPNYRHTEALLARVRTTIADEAENDRQTLMAELSQRVCDLMAARNWNGVEDTLNQLQKAGASDTDVASKRAEVKRQRDLEALYNQGLAHFQAQRWQDAIAVLKRVVRTEPKYAPPKQEQADALLARAQQAYQNFEKEQEKARQLANLYRQAEERLAERDWQHAIELLNQINKTSPDAPGLTSKLATAKRQRDLASKFATAQSHLQAGQWQAASAVLQTIISTEPDYCDPTWGKASTLLSMAQNEQVQLGNAQTRKSVERAPRKASENERPANLTRPSEPNAGDILTIDTPIHLDLVYVQAGVFLMGSDKGKDASAKEREQPQHMVNQPGFYIGKYPVTNAQYAIFVKANGYPVPKRWENGKTPSGKEDHPVVGVSWEDAIAFCKWLTKTTGKDFGLPSEAQWEKAASWDASQHRKRIYPWGDTFDAQRCNAGKGKSAADPSAETPIRLDQAFRSSNLSPKKPIASSGRGLAAVPPNRPSPARSSALGTKPSPTWFTDRKLTGQTSKPTNFPQLSQPQSSRAISSSKEFQKLLASIDLNTTTRVGLYSPGGDSPNGVADMAGNVWEWTSSLFRQYPFNPNDGRQKPDASGDRVLRGGSHTNPGESARSSCRGKLDSHETCNNVGFRVCLFRDR